MKTMEMMAAFQYILTEGQSLGSQHYYKEFRRTMLVLAGVLFCENEDGQTKWIIVYFEENAYLDAQGS